MRILVVGGAGFIGSVLIKRLLSEGHNIIIIDKLSLGSKKNIDQSLVNFYNIDINKIDKVIKILKKYPKIDEVWHLAANSDIPRGVTNVEVDLNDTFMSTVSILKIMKKIKCKKICFASSSAIYGFNNIKLHEDIGPLFPISNYGAMKLSSEALLSASLETFIDKVCIYRFPNVVGIPASHGVIYDFIRKLKKNMKILNVLGNGFQKKIYLHVNELVDAMCFINKKSKNGLNYFNIGSKDNGVSVKKIAEKVIKVISPKARVVFEKGDRGWPGDVPFFNYSTDKLTRLGWSPKMTSLQAIEKAIKEIAQQEKLFK